MSIINSGVLLGAEASVYQIERSLRFNSADSAYLVNSSTRTVAAGAYTFSFWIKRCALGGFESIWSSDDGTGASNKFVVAAFGTDNKFYWYHYTGNDADAAQSNGVLRDISAWYHIVFSKPASAVGTLYINGVAQTKQTSYTADADAFAAAKYIGRRYSGTSYSNCYLTEFYGIDGQALTPSSFGETSPVTGVWQPKRYSGTYGTNGFYLKFADNSGTTSTTLGKDSSGNGNNWTPNNFSVTAGAGNDSMIDTPTLYADGGNGRGNYCTLNPITSNATGYLIPPINGNLDAYLTAGYNAYFGVAGTQAVTSGKFYWEVTPTTIQTGAGTWMEIGIIRSTLAYPAGSALGSFNGGFGYTNDAYKGRSGSYSAYGATWTANDVIGVALDADNGSITFYKNGVSQGAAYTDLAGYNLLAGYYPAIAIYRSTGTSQYAVFNFGQRDFAYTPPSGFKALNTQNLPEPTIKKPGVYVNTVTYTGNGAPGQTITGVGFSPELVFIQSRSSSSYGTIHDAVRGSTLALYPGLGDADLTASTLVTGFTSDGFTLGSATQNVSGASYAAWCWDKSVAPGFDIVAYTGNSAIQTVAHSLNVAPSLIIIKNRTTTANWVVYTANGGASKYMFLNSSNAQATGGGYWNSTAPTSSGFTLGPDYFVNAGTPGNYNQYIAYLWAEVTGFSKFGSYVGNGSTTDGPYVHLGFRPRWIMIKRTDNVGDWTISDAVRPGYNVTNNAITVVAPSFSGERTTSYQIDFLSNGFKLRGDASDHNSSAGTYFFAAFAESPFKYSLAR